VHKGALQWQACFRYRHTREIISFKSFTISAFLDIAIRQVGFPKVYKSNLIMKKLLVYI